MYAGHPKEQSTWSRVMGYVEQVHSTRGFQVTAPHCAAQCQLTHSLDHEPLRVTMHMCHSPPKILQHRGIVASVTLSYD